MQYSELGRTGVQVSRVGLGTMTWGDQNTALEGHTQMSYALDQDINLFDTSEMYSIPPKPDTQGSTERIIGEWFAAEPSRRERVVLASKVAGASPMNWLREDGGPTRQTRAQIDEAVEKSLKRLRTDRIDLYQLHWPDRLTRNFGGTMTFHDYPTDFEPFEAILEALDAHVQKGNIRFIGVSNETPWGVMRFVAEAEKRGLPRMASIQNAYNLVNRTFEYGLAEIAMREQVGLLAYSPLAQGYLTGKYRGGALPQGSRKQLFNRLQRYEGAGADRAIQSYLDLAVERGIDADALALKFCDTRPFVTSTLIGATSMQQLKADIAAFDLDWPDDLEQAVNALHAEQPNPCP